MDKKHDIEVIIQNKRYTLCGYESEEYLQKIASYINGLYTEYKSKDFYRHLEADMKNILLQINIADDYFKAKKKIDDLKAMNDQKNEELFDIKHEVIAAQTELAEAKEEIERLKKELDEANKRLLFSGKKGKR